MQKRYWILTFIFLFVLLMLPGATLAYDYNGATYNDNDFTKLQTFLNQPSAVAGKTNGQQLNADYDQNDPATWSGITWENGRVIYINWQDKSLSGDLDISNFSELLAINSRDNLIDKINLTNDTKLDHFSNRGDRLSQLILSPTASIATIGSGYFEINSSSFPNCYIDAVALSTGRFINWTLSGSVESTLTYYNISNLSGTLVANFSEPYHQVSFITNGDTSVDSIIAEEGRTISSPQPHRNGYEFCGWYKDEALTNIWNFSIDTIPANDITLYAKWTPGIYTITFDYQGESEGPQNIQVDSGNLIEAPAIPTKEGCVFGGWYCKEYDNGTYFNFSTYQVYKDITLHARWFDAHDYNKINDFLSLSSGEIGKTNGQCINCEPNKPLTWGVIWTSGATRKIRAINWSDVNIDGILDLSGMQTLSDINIYKTSINEINLNGVCELKNLSCSSNDLTSLDISNNVLLEELNCSGNKLSSLDISNNPNLTYLSCNSNHLSEIDISKNKLLKKVYLVNNNLNSINSDGADSLETMHLTFNNLLSLDCYTNNSLKYLYCSFNHITSFNFSINSQLVTLECVGNGLTSLNLANNKTLKGLNCSSNPLASLDISNNTELTRLVCNNTPLTNINLSDNIQLRFLYCYNNNLGTIDLSQNIYLRKLICYNCQLTSLDLSNNSHLIELECYNNRLTALNLDNNVELESLLCYTNYLTSLNTNNNIHLKKIDCCDNLLTALDISNNSNLTMLKCDNNQISEIKINSALLTLNCSGNQLGNEFDVSQLSHLYRLDCSDNMIQVLKLPKKTINWHYFNCFGNQIKEINTIFFNQPITIISNSNGYANAKYDYDNHLYLEAIAYEDTDFINWTINDNVVSDLNPCDIPSISSGDTITANFSKAIVSFNSKGGNEITAITVDCGTIFAAPNAPAKNGYVFTGWYKEKECINKWDFGSDTVSENTTLYAKWNNNENICSVIFDSNGGNLIYDIGIEKGSTFAPPAEPVRNGFIFCGWYKENTFETLWDFENDTVTNTTTLYARWCPIGYNEDDFFKIQKIFNQPSTIGGLTLGECLNKSRSYLYGYYNSENPLTWDSISWQKVDGEKYVKTINWGDYINGNLDLSGLSNLTSLVLYRNKISSLDASNNIKLEILHCSNNKISEINISNDTALTDFECSTNQLTSIDLSTNIALNTLDCRINQLTSLDISKNTILSRLYCSGNKLTNITGSFFGKTTSINTIGNGYIYIYTDTYPICSIYTFEHSDSKFYNWTSHDEELSTSASLSMIASMPDTITANFCQPIIFYNTKQSVHDGVYEYLLLPLNSSVPMPTPPTKTGYTFAGWYEERECINEFDFDNEVVDKKIILYSKWITNTYTVTYYNYEGLFLDSITVDYNTKLTEPDPPARPDWTFIGWASQYDNDYWDFDRNTIKRDTNLYAVYDPYCTVKFDSQGGSAIDDITVLRYVTINEPISPMRENNTFLGWYKESRCIYQWNFNSDCPQSSVTTLYAKWSTNIVSFDSNGGSEIEDIIMPFGGKINKPDIEKTGYTFAGWYTDSDFNKKWDFGFGNKVTTNITLYARWIANDNYELTKLRDFLNQPSAVAGKTNGQQLSDIYNPYDITTWSSNIQWEIVDNEYHVVSMRINQQSLSGNLDINNFSELYYFTCTQNDLSSINAENNPALVIFFCGGNASLDSLSIDNCPLLEHINCEACNLATLTIENSTNLTRLNCRGNQLTLLTIRNNPKLEKINCSINKLTTLDVSSNSILSDLNCVSNQLTSLDLSESAHLTKLSCSYNPLKNIRVLYLNKVINIKAKGSGYITLYLSTDINIATAIPISSSEFLGWSVSGSTISTDTRYTLTSSLDDTLVAEFNVPITMTPYNAGYGTLEGTGKYNYNDTVTITATPRPGYRFVCLLEDGATVTTNNKYIFTAKESRNFTVKFAKIATPSISSATSSGYNSITLKWDSVTGANSYNIYRSTSKREPYSKIASTSSTSYKNTKLTTGKTYYYKIKAVCVAGSTTTYSSTSAYKYAKPIPSTPSTTVKSSSYKSIKISWGKVSGASGYRVYRATSKSGTYKLIKTTTSTSYTNSSLRTGKRYYYKVRPYKWMNSKRIYGNYSSIKSEKPIPSTPSVTVKSSSYKSIKINWGKVSGASGYRVYRATSKSGTYKLIKTTTSTSYTNSSLTTGKAYYYKVRAYKWVSGKRVYGKYSSIKSAKPVPSRPSSFSVRRYSSSKIKISYGRVSGASGYRIYRATSRSGTYKLVKTTTSRSWINTGRTKGKTYYYKVRAYKWVSGKRVYGPYTTIRYTKT